MNRPTAAKGTFPDGEGRATGLFNSRDNRRGGPRAGFVPMNRRAANGHSFAANKRLLAEALSDGAETIAGAARQIGLSVNAGHKLFAAIRADLGWQAV